jgi:hypothetical protein
MRYNDCELCDVPDELARLRALAVRVRKIEWVDGKEDSWGDIGPIKFIVSQFGSVWYVEGNDFISRESRWDSRATAKAACQSAFEAWVWRFVEVGE